MDPPGWTRAARGHSAVTAPPPMNLMTSRRLINHLTGSRDAIERAAAFPFCDLLHRTGGISRACCPNGCPRPANESMSLQRQPLDSRRARAKLRSAARRNGRHQGRRMGGGQRKSARAKGPSPPAMPFEVLQSHPIFGGIGAERIKQLCAFATVRKVKAGATIFAKGDPGTALFAARQGT